MQNHAVSRWLCLGVLLVPVGPASAAALEWSTLFEAASGPPYPSSERVQFGLGEGLLLPAVQRSRIQIGLESVLGDGSVMPASLLGSDNGAGGIAAPRGSLNFSIGGPVAGNLQMDILIEAFGDGSVRQGAVMQDFHFNVADFDLLFDVLERSGAVHKHVWHGSIPPGQPFAFGNGSAQLLGDGSVRLLLGLNRLAGDQIRDQPVVAMNMSAGLVPEPVTALLLGLGAISLRRRVR